MSERLYNLLPEIYRTLDYEKDEPLRALMQVLESEYEVVSHDIARLYGDWFIETCEEWVVPYIADLLAVKGVRADGAVSLRAYVANTIHYRRRKGTAQVIEEVARDLVMRPAKAQEFEFLLAHTQHMNHLRMKRLGTMQVHSPDICCRVDTAFDQSMHLAEVGLISTGQGYHNLPNVGVSVWRVESYFVAKADAFKVAANHFTFDPFGRDLPVYTFLRTRLESFESTTEADVVEPIPRRVMDNELRGIRAGIADEDGVYFGTQPTFQIFLNGSSTAVEPRHIYAADLSVWRAPAATGNPADPILVAVDPASGRIATQAGRVTKVKVSYCFGTPGAIGGGYRRSEPKSDGQNEAIFVVTSLAGIQQAFLAWDSVNYPKLRLILDTSDTLTGTITLAAMNAQITLEAGQDQRPSLIGDIDISGAACPKSVSVMGLWIDGQIKTPKLLKSLAVHDVTVLPDAHPSIVTADGSADLEIDIQRCKLGKCDLDRDIVKASFQDTVVHVLNDNSLTDRLGDYGPPLSLIRCTVFGAVKAKEILMCSESIVIGVVTAERTQVGCVRFSWLPLNSRAPRRFYCQPNLEYDELSKKFPSLAKAKIADMATTATYPRFESRKPNTVAYAQLGHGCPRAVCRGAENEGEMGVWNLLNEQERLSNFANALGEYLRFGLEAGLIKRS